MVVKRGVNDDRSSPMARHFRGSGHMLRFIEYMDVGTTNGWRLDDVVPGRRDRRADRRAMAARAARGQLSRRGRAPLPLPRRRRRDRRHRLGHPAVLRRCTRARLSAEGKLYTCLFAGAGTTCAPRCAAAPATRRCASRSQPSGPCAPTATPNCDPRDQPHAESGDVVHRRLAPRPGDRDTIGPSP